MKHDYIRGENEPSESEYFTSANFCEQNLYDLCWYNKNVYIRELELVNLFEANSIYRKKLSFYLKQLITNLGYDITNLLPIIGR